ncbi:MAG: DUF1489 family protein [Rhizomicrobium sp.]
MTLHLIKLSVGSESLADLSRWQNARLKEKKKKRQPLLLQHVTRMTPKRADELLDGGSIYWVIKGQIVARQKLVELKPVKKEGKPHCALVYEPKLILVARRRHRPFQGWRYLLPKNAPPDITDPKSAKNLPEDLKSELAELGLL